MRAEEDVIENRRLADNHVGWEVQVFKKGTWRRVGEIKETRPDAIEYLVEYEKFWPQFKYRVYESVKGME